VRLLVFSHVIPPLPAAPIESLFAKGVAEVWQGPFVVARDGMVFTLRAGDESISRAAF
jgi:ribonuclease Z